MRIEKLAPEFDDLIDSDNKIEEITHDMVFTEGPVWNSKTQSLIFSDIPSNKIFTWTASNGVQIFRKDSNFSNGLTYNPQGELIACEHKSRSVTRTVNNREIQAVATHFHSKKLNSPNDVISAQDGSILFTDPIYGLNAGMGGPAEMELDFEGVFLCRPESDPVKPRLVTDSFERPNGLAFSPDESLLYIADTVRQHIRVFHVEDGWKFSGGQVWAELWDDEYCGRPDGMKVDSRGNLFTTGPGGVWVFNPQAELLGRIYLPDKTSNLAWGEDGHSLFITSTAKVFRIRCKTRGKILL